MVFLPDWQYYRQMHRIEKMIDELNRERFERGKDDAES